MGQAIIVTIGVTVIAYLLLYLLNVRTSGGIARSILGSRSTPQAIALFDREHWFDRSFFVQYWHFILQLVGGGCPSAVGGGHGCNLGYSYQYNRTADSLLGTELPRDLVLGGLSLIFSLVIAIPIGVAQAVKRNQAVDYIGTGVSFILYSMPQYAVALILIQILSISFHVFPAVAPSNYSWLQMLEHPNQLVLPVASLTLVSFAYFSRYMRSSALDTLAQDYIRTARAKGLSERLVLSRHLLRNSLITVVTLVGLSIPVVITGTVITEAVFNYPGVGYEYLQAAVNNDFEVMLGITVLVGVITVLGNLMADIGYALLDPRVRY